MNMAYQDFINDFKKDILGDAICFYGAEDFLMNWAVNQIIEKYVDESARNLDLQYLDGDTSAADIMGAARAYSMFSDKRVVVVKNYLPFHKKTSDNDAEALLDFCSKKQESSILIFTLDSTYEGDITAYGKKLIKACSSYEFSKLDKAGLKAFINKRVHEASKEIGHRELEYLIDLSGYYNKNSEYSLIDFDRDLIKITSASESDNIFKSDIDGLLIGDEDKFVFNLIDALMAGNKKQAMEIAETIIAEDDGSMQVLALLGKQFEIMYDSLELSEQGLSVPEMAKRIGINEFRFKKAYQSAHNFSISKLKRIITKIYNIDKDIKTGDIDKDTAFELLIVSIY